VPIHHAVEDVAAWFLMPGEGILSTIGRIWGEKFYNHTGIFPLTIVYLRAILKF
jgi:hypothetical protein